MNRVAKLGLAVLGAAVLAASLALNAGAPAKKIRVIYTNDTAGYIEPCGCGGRKQGGLARRAPIITKLVQENPNSVIVESGNLTDAPTKIGLIMSAMALAKYDAVGVGEADLRVSGEQYFIEAAKHKVTVIDTRVGAPKSTLPFVVKNVDGVRVGIVSFGGAPFDEQADEYQRRKAMYSAFKAARQGSDILILLDQGNVVTPDWLERNGKRLGVPDVVVSGTARTGLTEPEVQGKTRIMPTSMQTRQVGVLDIEFTPGQEPKYAWSRIENNEKLPKDEVVQKLIDEFMNRFKVAQSPAAPTAPVTPPAAAPKTGGSADNKPYYPPDLCKACHVKQFDDWVKTKHAVAVKTLLQASRMVPECLTCHSEEYRRLGRVTASVSGIGGVDCASCHINSLPHGMERKAVAQRSKVNAVGCLECHTKDRSPNYDEQAYFPKVSHIGAADSQSTEPSEAPAE